MKCYNVKCDEYNKDIEPHCNGIDGEILDYCKHYKAEPKSKTIEELKSYNWKEEKSCDDCITDKRDCVVLCRDKDHYAPKPKRVDLNEMVENYRNGCAVSTSPNFNAILCEMAKRIEENTK